MPPKPLKKLPLIDAAVARWAEVKSTHQLVRFVIGVDVLLLLVSHFLPIAQYFHADFPAHTTWFATITGGGIVGLKISEVVKLVPKA